jgi:hypothetical protein
VSAAGKKIPVLVSPVGEMAGAAAVPVPLVIFVMDVRVGMVAVVLFSVATVPVVELRFVIVPVVIVAAVDVVVPNVPVSIVPVVILAVGRVWAKFATVMRLSVFESEASPKRRVSLVAVTVSAVRSWISPEVGVALFTSAPSLAAVTSLATPSTKVVPAVNEAIVLSPIR